MRWFWQRKPQSTPNTPPPETSGGAEPPAPASQPVLPDPADAFVHVLDLQTGALSMIPAAELAPGMVRARMEGMEGEVWVDSALLTPHEYQHPPFPEDVRDRLREIKAALDEVHPMSLDAWEDGFRRDRTPEHEIAHWLHLAQVYSRLTASDDPLGATPESRQDVFRVLSGCGIAPREQVLSVVSLSTISREDAERIIAAFFDPIADNNPLN